MTMVKANIIPKYFIIKKYALDTEYVHNDGQSKIKHKSIVGLVID